jgi:hypothetical protein
MRLVRTRSAAIAARQKISAIIASDALPDDVPMPVTAQTKTTSNTLHYMAPKGNRVPSADMLWSTDIKQPTANIIHQYMDNIVNCEDKHLAFPEMIKFLIANPAIIIYHPRFADVVLKKMDDFSVQIDKTDTIGKYHITNSYRSQFKGLIRILKQITAVYSKLALHDAAFYESLEKRPFTITCTN